MVTLNQFPLWEKIALPATSCWPDVGVKSITEFPPTGTYSPIQTAVNLVVAGKWTQDDINTYGDISDWDVSQVTNMSYLFANAQSMVHAWKGPRSQTFSVDLSKWDVSNVKDMSYMFAGMSCDWPRGGISGWTVSNVENMRHMFYGTFSFNDDLSGWDVSNVTNITYMFYGAVNFNKDITSWKFNSQNKVCKSSLCEPWRVFAGSPLWQNKDSCKKLKNWITNICKGATCTVTTKLACPGWVPPSPGPGPGWSYSGVI